LRKTADVRYADVRFVGQSTEKLSVRDGRPEQISSGASRGIGIRVLTEKAWGFASTEDLTASALRRAALRATELARASGRVARTRVLFPEMEAARGQYTTPLSIDPFTVPLDRKLARLEAPVRALLAKKPIHSAESWMEWTRVSKHLLSTEG